ncbi:MAG: hypothetical protein JRD88_09410 [Deltaproteobacteria bacterium]|nr:hypothetical protein [Deltaproteobacteria bacterium]
MACRILAGCHLLERFAMFKTDPVVQTLASQAEINQLLLAKLIEGACSVYPNGGSSLEQTIWPFRNKLLDSSRRLNGGHSPADPATSRQVITRVHSASRRRFHPLWTWLSKYP